MAIRLRRTLFIGLGGTGIETLLHIKRRLVETYGATIPPMIGFIGVDTDKTSGGFQKTKKTTLADYSTVQLDASEQCAITVSNPKDIYLRNKKEFGWMPPRNADCLLNLEKGAGQVRTNGRFALLCNTDLFKTILQVQLNKIKDSTIIDKQKYALIDNDVEIYVIGSIAGGTGCGTFIDIGYLIRKHFESTKDRRYKLCANLFLPHVYKQMLGMDPTNPQTANMYPNAYAALNDLDFLMHTSMENPIYLSYTTGEERFDTPPYHSITLIDNSDKNGFTYDHINKLEEMAALSLSLTIGDFGDTSSMMDNVLTYVSTGQMDIQGKKSWASGMGVCEIAIDGNALANIYAYRYGYRIIQGIINTCDDTIAIANNWIDSPDINIRENNGDENNNLIDQILPIKLLPFTLGDINSMEAEISTYLLSNEAKKETVQSITKSLCKRLPEELDSLILTNLNRECGIGNVLGILSTLQKEISLYLLEMVSELEMHSKNIEYLESSVKASKQDLIAINGSFMPFSKRSRLTEARQDLEVVVYDLAVNKLEITRKNEAKIIFSLLYEQLMAKEREYKNLKSKLESILSDYNEQTSYLVNKKNDSDKEFIIELMGNYARKVEVKDSELDYPMFFKELCRKNEDGLSDLMSMDVKAISRKFFDIVLKTDNALKWRNIQIETALSEISKEERVRIFERAVQKSNILLNYDHKGYSLNPSLSNTFVVGVRDKNASILVDERLIENMVSGANDKVSYTSTNMNNSIVIYRQLFALPAFSLTPFDACEYEYTSKTENGSFFHIDSDLRLKMDKASYNINPADNESLDIVELWVQGILHKFIVNNNGTYQIKSKSKGDPLDGYWVTLAQDNYRDDAFDEFSRNIDLYITELQSGINDVVKKMGDDVYQAFLNNIRSGQPSPEISYYNNFSQISITLSELKENRNYVRIANLIRDEFNYLNLFLAN